MFCWTAAAARPLPEALHSTVAPVCGWTRVTRWLAHDGSASRENANSTHEAICKRFMINLQETIRSITAPIRRREWINSGVAIIIAPEFDLA
jgi:hypothetical protein